MFGMSHDCSPLACSGHALTTPVMERRSLEVFLRITRECFDGAWVCPVVMQVKPCSCSSSPGLQFPKEAEGLFLAK